MKPFSKYFTPPLTHADRVAFFRSLGLNHYAFRYFELSGNQVLESVVFERAHSRARLTPSTNQEWLKERNASLLPVLSVFHPSGELTYLPVQREKSVWEEVFPHPFSLAIFALGESDLRQVEIYPEPAKLPLHSLARALNHLEEKMKAVEVSLLWVRNGALRFPLLFHYVRRRRVRLGTSPFLYELGEKFDRGELGKEGLVETFGTHALLACVDVSPLREREAMEAAADACRTATYLTTDLPVNLTAGTVQVRSLGLPTDSRL